MQALERGLSRVSALNGVEGSEMIHPLINLVPRGTLDGSTLTPDTLEYYSFDHAELITPYVEELFANALLDKDATEVHRFLHSAAGDAAVAGFRGRLYERVVAIPRIRRGSESHSKLPLRRLADDSQKHLVMQDLLKSENLDLRKGLQPVKFRDISNLRTKWAANKGDAIFVPLSGTFPVVDFVLRIGDNVIPANSTVSASHKVKVGNPQFLALLDALGLTAVDADDEIPLVWVLPHDAFETFEVKDLESASGVILVRGATGRNAVAKRLVQYKLRLDIPPVLSKPPA